MCMQNKVESQRMCIKWEYDMYVYIFVYSCILTYVHQVHPNNDPALFGRPKWTDPTSRVLRGLNWIWTFMVIGDLPQADSVKKWSCRGRRQTFCWVHVHFHFAFLDVFLLLDFGWLHPWFPIFLKVLSLELIGSTPLVLVRSVSLADSIAFHACSINGDWLTGIAIT